MASSQVRADDRPANSPSPRNARRYVSWVRSSALAASTSDATNRHTSPWVARTNPAASRAGSGTTSTRPKATGNFSRVRNDYPAVMCEDVQAALSARLDGEEPGLEDALVEAHVAGCVTCATWLAGAQKLTVPVAEPTDLMAEPPDLTERIKAAGQADP